MCFEPCVQREQAGIAVFFRTVTAVVDYRLPGVQLALLRHPDSVGQDSSVTLVGHGLDSLRVKQGGQFGRHREFRADSGSVDSEQGLSAQAAEPDGLRDDEVAAGAVEHHGVVVLDRLDYVFTHVGAVAAENDCSSGIPSGEFIVVPAGEGCRHGPSEGTVRHGSGRSGVEAGEQRGQNDQDSSHLSLFSFMNSVSRPIRRMYSCTEMPGTGSSSL